MFNNTKIENLESKVKSLENRIQTLLCKSGEHAEQKIGLRSFNHKPHVFCSHCYKILSESIENEVK